MTLGRRVGLTQEQIDELDRHATSAAFTPLERLVLEYADELTRNIRPRAGLVEELQRHLSARDIVELTLIIGMANLTTRFNEALAVELEEGPPPIRPPDPPKMPSP